MIEKGDLRADRRTVAVPELLVGDGNARGEVLLAAEEAEAPPHVRSRADRGLEPGEQRKNVLCEEADDLLLSSRASLRRELPLEEAEVLVVLAVDPAKIRAGREQMIAEYPAGPLQGRSDRLRRHVELIERRHLRRAVGRLGGEGAGEAFELGERGELPLTAVFAVDRAARRHQTDVRVVVGERRCVVATLVEVGAVQEDASRGRQSVGELAPKELVLRVGVGVDRAALLLVHHRIAVGVEDVAPDRHRERAAHPGRS
jgi:hypothetical protein